jgi:ABC-2 type transport system permease protein
MGLLRLAGVRRTRLVAQIVSTVIGASFIVSVQVWNLLPWEMRSSISATVAAAQNGGAFNVQGPLWIPVRAAGGDALALLQWCLLSLAVFAATVLLVGDVFARDAVRIAGLPDATRRRPARAARFKCGIGTSLRRKEWRLLARDPWLLSQMLLQVIYTLPVSFIIWKAMGPNGSVALSIGPAVVVIASQLSAALAWLTISSEDAPEFLASAPVTRAEVERSKLQAIALPIVIVIGLPLLGLAIIAPRTAAITCLFGCGAAVSTAMINIWHPIPGKRGNVMRRHSQSKFVAIMEHAMSMLWAVAMMLVALRSYAAAIPIAIACLLLWTNRPVSQTARARRI